MARLFLYVNRVSLPNRGTHIATVAAASASDFNAAGSLYDGK